MKRAQIEKTTVLDYDSARQRAWAIRAIYQDLVAEDPKGGPDQAISSALDQLDALLLTKLPSAKEQVSIESSLKTRLGFVSEYNQSAAREQFDKIRQRLAAH